VNIFTYRTVLIEKALLDTEEELKASDQCAGIRMAIVF